MRVIAGSLLVTRALVAAMLVAWFLLLRPSGLLGGNATYVLVEGRSMEPRYRTGDLVIAAPATEYRIGDIVVFRVPRGQPGAGGLVIHRIVDRAGDAFVVRGDANGWTDQWRPTAADILGRAEGLVPAVGRLLVVLRQPALLAAFAALAAFLVLDQLYPTRRRRPTPKEVARTVDA